MKRYRVLEQRESAWQTQAVKSAVRLLNGVLEDGEAAGSGGCEDGGGRIRLPGIGIPVGNPAIGSPARLWENLKNIQKENGVEGERRREPSFVLELPGGEGRYFAAVRIILELNRSFGLLKFVVTVPSVAARLKFLETARELSSRLSGMGFPEFAERCFSFQGENSGEVSARLVEPKELSVCIMNTQAFNRETNRLHLEDEYGQILWEDIRALRPVVIVDEPEQSGRGINRGELAIEELSPLFTLRFKPQDPCGYNKIFSLAEEAARKAGELKTVSRAGAGAAGEKIRLAVETHFKTQLSLLREGHRAKALTLFFTAAGREEREKYLAEFDREYRKAWLKYRAKFSSFLGTAGEDALFPEEDPGKTRRIFLGVDRRGRERELDGWEKKDGGSRRKRLLEDINRGIGRMLEERERMISPDSKTAFLFVHPALREGCENPNVFVICCLDGGISEASVRKKEACARWLPEDEKGRKLRGGTAARLWMIDSLSEQSAGTAEAEAGREKDGGTEVKTGGEKEDRTEEGTDGGKDRETEVKTDRGKVNRTEKKDSMEKEGSTDTENGLEQILLRLAKTAREARVEKLRLSLTPEELRELKDSAGRIEKLLK